MGCSRRLRQNIIQRWTISFGAAPNDFAFLNSAILALPFLMSSAQFSSHVNVLLIMVPNIFILSTTSVFSPLSFNLVLNWYFSVKLTIIALVFSFEISIFSWREAHSSTDRLVTGGTCPC